MPSRSALSDREVLDDVRAFFVDGAHRIYTSGGTPGELAPSSVFHMGQLEILFEQEYFHWRTNRALQALRADGTLKSEQHSYGSGTAQLVWHRSMRYVRRQLTRHLDLLEAYSTERMSKACGDQAEILVDLLLAKQRGVIEARNSRAFAGREWTRTAHDLDFIATIDGRTYGVEVKNTFPYIDNDELRIKIDMCQHLQIQPMFIVRRWHDGQRQLARRGGGDIFMFQTKAFPPGWEDLTKSLWTEMRLPVAVWKELPPRFAGAVARHVASHE